MRILSELSGISFGEADIFRKLLETPEEKMDSDKLKKKEKWKKRFVEGCSKNKIDEETAVRVFDWLVKGAGYSFNKSHCYSYANNSYQMLYLKVYYFVEFMVCTLRLEKKDDKLLEAIKECYDAGLQIKSANVNLSGVDFKIEDRDTIRVGFIKIKNIGVPAAEIIMDNKPQSGYKSIEDFLFRNHRDMGIVKRILIYLAQTGVFDGVEPNRKVAIEKIQLYEKHYQDFMKLNVNFADAFELFEMTFKMVYKKIDINKELSKTKRQNYEKELLGFIYDFEVKNKMKVKEQIKEHRKQKMLKESKMNNSKMSGQIVEVGFDKGVYRIKLKKQNDKTITLKFVKEQIKKYKSIMKKGNCIEILFENEDGKNVLKDIVLTSKSDAMQKDVLETEEKVTKKITGEGKQILAEKTFVIYHSGKADKETKVVINDVLINGGKDKIKFIIDSLKFHKWTKEANLFVKYLSRYSGKCKKGEVDFIIKNLYNDKRYLKLIKPKIFDKSKEDLLTIRKKVIKKISGLEKIYEDNKEEYDKDKDMRRGFEVSMNNNCKILERVDYSLLEKHNYKAVHENGEEKS